MSNASTSVSIKRAEDVTPERAREIAKSLGHKITGEVGTTDGRILFLVTFVLSLLWIFLSIAKWLFVSWADIVGFVGFLFVMAGTGGLEQFFTNVPKFGALVTTNFFTGTMHVFPPGLHVRFPWDSFHITDYISTRPDTLTKTSTFRTKDGVPITYRWGFTIGPVLRLLPVYIRIPVDTIDENLTEVGETALSTIIGDKTAEEMRQPATIKEACDSMTGLLEVWQDSNKNTIEEWVGSNVERFTISPPAFPQDYDEASTVKVMSTLINDSAREIHDKLGVGPDAALNAVLMLNKEEVKKQITEIALGKDLVDALRDLGIGATGAVRRLLPNALPPQDNP